MGLKSVIGSVLRPSTGGGDLYMSEQLMTGGISVGLVSSRLVSSSRFAGNCRRVFANRMKVPNRVKAPSHRTCEKGMGLTKGYQT